MSKENVAMTRKIGKVAEVCLNFPTGPTAIWCNLGAESWAVHILMKNHSNQRLPHSSRQGIAPVTIEVAEMEVATIRPDNFRSLLSDWFSAHKFKSIVLNISDSMNDAYPISFTSMTLFLNLLP